MPFSGSVRPLTVSCRGLTNPLLAPWNRLEVVSKQVAPAPSGPDWKVLPSATLNRTGLLQSPEQGVACCGWQYCRQGSISFRQVV